MASILEMGIKPLNFPCEPSRLRRHPSNLSPSSMTDPVVVFSLYSVVLPGMLRFFRKFAFIQPQFKLIWAITKPTISNPKKSWIASRVFIKGTRISMLKNMPVAAITAKVISNKRFTMRNISILFIYSPFSMKLLFAYGLLSLPDRKKAD